MAIIGKVERKNWKVKLLNISIHVILLLGAATMVYPLLIMVSGSLKSGVDFFEFSLLPEYVYDNSLLYKKYLQTKYESVGLSNMFNTFRLPFGSLVNIPLPEFPSQERYDDYKQFLTQMRQTKPHYWRMVGMVSERGVIPSTLRGYRAWLVAKFGPGPKGLEAMNRAYGSDYTSWGDIRFPSENFLNRRGETNYTSPILKDLLEFKNNQVTGFDTCWTDIDAPYVGWLRQTYSNHLSELNKALGTNFNTWSEITLPVECPKGNAAYISTWRNYVCDRLNLAFVSIRPEAAPYWQTFLQKKYHGNVSEFNRVHNTAYAAFQNIPMPTVVPTSGQLKSDWSDFLLVSLPSQYIRLNSLGEEYRLWLQKRFGTLDKVNEKFELGYRSFEEIKLPDSFIHGNLQQGKDWLEFLSKINPEDTGLARTAIGEYRDFILSKFTVKGKPDYKEMSMAFKKKISSPFEIPFYSNFPTSPNVGSKVKDLYREFIFRPEQASSRVLPHPEKLKNDWFKFLKGKYGNDIKKLNQAWSMIYTDWHKITPPVAEYEWFTVLANRAMLIKEYLKRNYLMVFDTIQTNGFAAKNTLIYCLLAVMASLLVNPLCAYALSRYKMAPAYKILLFLMLPMAFPAMVLGIPQFLLIKNLGLLNTFAALILPGMANGYMIFLLKGFFDSLPKELFESAALDGASEWTVFWHIAMGLSTPILSVLALNTFTAAYGNFMMAFLLCQDKSMWTMMVYLYQLQQHSSQAVGFAALIIAAIPTLLVFIFCQNIIIKGIVVPTEK